MASSCPCSSPGRAAASYAAGRRFETVQGLASPCSPTAGGTTLRASVVAVRIRPRTPEVPRPNGRLLLGARSYLTDHGKPQAHRRVVTARPRHFRPALRAGARSPFVWLARSVRHRGRALDGRCSDGTGSEALNLVFAGSIPARSAARHAFVAPAVRARPWYGRGRRFESVRRLRVDVAQPAECHLAKVEAAGSIPVVRSKPFWPNW